MVTESSTSENVPVLLTLVNSGAVLDGLSAATDGATSLPLTVKEVVLIDASAFLAWMVTVYGLDSSGAVPVHFHVPPVLPIWLTEPPPDSTVMVTESSTSENVPVLLRPVNSGAATDELS